MRCKVLLGSFCERDPFRGQEGGERLQRARVSIEPAENNQRVNSDFFTWINIPDLDEEEHTKKKH